MRRLGWVLLTIGVAVQCCAYAFIRFFVGSAWQSTVPQVRNRARLYEGIGQMVIGAGILLVLAGLVVGAVHVCRRAGGKPGEGGVRE